MCYSYDDDGIKCFSITGAYLIKTGIYNKYHRYSDNTVAAIEYNPKKTVNQLLNEFFITDIQTIVKYTHIIIEVIKYTSIKVSIFYNEKLQETFFQDVIGEIFKQKMLDYAIIFRLLKVYINKNDNVKMRRYDFGNMQYSRIDMTNCIGFRKVLNEAISICNGNNESQVVIDFRNCLIKTQFRNHWYNHNLPIHGCEVKYREINGKPMFVKIGYENYTEIGDIENHIEKYYKESV